MPQTARCEQIETENMVGLGNGLVELGFDIKSGALVRLYNRATEDEYLIRRLPAPKAVGGSASLDCLLRAKADTT